MDETDKLIREDQEQHPNCSYSISNTKTCRTKDGSLVCEMMKSINRNCPSKRPVNIYSSTTKFDDKNESGMSGESLIPGFHDPFALFKELERSLGAPSGDRSINRERSKELPRTDEKSSKEPGTWIEFRFGNDAFNDEGLLGSIFKNFGIGGLESKAPDVRNTNPKSNESGPKVPPGTKVGPPEDI